MHISFVILHYITKKDTIECVDSILNLTYKDYSIIVVDNGSPNNSGVELKELYKNNDKVEVLLSGTNLGFAKGNNIGFKYAKEVKNADFIVMANNDTIIEQRDFCEKLLKEYKSERFAIAGPDIISLIDKQHQNPVPKIFRDVNAVKIKRLKFICLKFLNLFGLDELCANLFSRKKNQIISINKTKVSDIQLHGSCLIFAKEYIEKYDGLYDKTFMYLEECILKYIADRDKLIIRYIEDISIYHKEDSSTNELYKKESKKRRFYYKNSIESCNLLIKLMSDGSNKESA